MENRSNLYQSLTQDNTALSIRIRNKIGSKFFSATYDSLLQQYPQLTEEFLLHLRASKLKAIFGYHTAKDETIAQRFLILAVLQKNGILSYEAGRVDDHDWLPFLTSLDPEKLAQFARVFEHIQEIEISDKSFFTRVKSYQDLSDLAENLDHQKAFNQTYGMSGILDNNTQIKGFTLINEHVCKRTRQFPKPWKQAMRAAWDQPSSEASFEVYKLYTERQSWLASFKLPIIRAFLSYFYAKPIFQTFNAEPLTELCSLLHSVGELNLTHFKMIENLPETALAYCKLLRRKNQLDAEHIQDIQDIPESILQNICTANEAKFITPSTLKILIKLGKHTIDGTTWMIHEPNWLVLSELSVKSLKHLGSLDLNKHIFATVKWLHNQHHLDLFEQLTPEQQTDILTHGHHEKIITILLHLQKLGLFTPNNIQTVFDHKSNLIKDKKLYQSIISLDKTNVKKDQKRFNRLLQVRERTPSEASVNAESAKQIADIRPTPILSTASDEDIPHQVSLALQTFKIKMSAVDLEAYSPAVLRAFHAAFPLFREDELLTQNNVKAMLRFFSAAPDPQIRCQCMIILFQCGLLSLENFAQKVPKLETLYTDDPALFREIYAEAWLQTETTAKWLEQTIEAGLTPSDSSVNTEETLIQRYAIENEENAAYLALDDLKHKIADHPNPPLIQQTLKLLDKSKLKIADSFDGLLQVNETNLQKIYAWLFILNKANLLNIHNASRILLQHQTWMGDLNALKQIVSALKAKPEVNLDTILKQTQVDQMLSDDVTLPNKQKILDYVKLAIHNPSATAKLAFMVADVTDVAAEQAKMVQEHLGRHAETLASAAVDVSHQLYGKLKLFTAQAVATVQAPSAKTLELYTSIVQHHKKFKGSYYQTHATALQNDLRTLHAHHLLSKPNVLWLAQHPHQEWVSRFLNLFASINLLKDSAWQEKLTALAESDPLELSKLEKKCLRVLETQEAVEVKEKTVRGWLDPLIRARLNGPH